MADVTISVARTALELRTSTATLAYSANELAALLTNATTAAGLRLKAGVLRVVDDTDTTKRIAFAASGITTGTTRTLTVPDASGTLPLLSLAQTWTVAQTFRAANAIRSEAAATQDAMILAGRAGGSSSYASTLTTAALTASRTITFPDATGTAALLSLAQTFTASQRFDAAEAILLGTAGTAGNGLLQLASGTTKATGIAFGSGEFFHRKGTGSAVWSDGAGEIIFGIDTTNGNYCGSWSAHSFRLLAGGAVCAVLKTTGQLRFIPIAADPAGAEAGDVYYNSTTNKLRVYNGAWVDLH